MLLVALRGSVFGLAHRIYREHNIIREKRDPLGQVKDLLPADGAPGGFLLQFSQQSQSALYFSLAIQLCMCACFSVRTLYFGSRAALIKQRIKHMVQLGQRKSSSSLL